MTFGNPAMLWLLAIPLALGAWETQRRGRRLALPFDHGEQRRGAWLARGLLAANLLPALLLAVAVVLLARPLQRETPRQERALTNIEFVMDVSGSMGSEFGEGTRFDAATRAINEFALRRSGDAFGLTIFGNEVLRWMPLTRDVKALSQAAPFLRPETLPQHFGGTEIGKAIRFCRETLVKRGAGDRLIVLLSDGVSADLDGDTPARIGAELAQDGVVLYAVHIGEDFPHQLQRMVQPTGGRVFAAGNAEALSAVFAHIDRMRPVRLKPAATRQVDAYGPWATAGLALFAAYGLALFGWRYTPW